VAAHALARINRQRRAQLLFGIYAVLNEDSRMFELARAVFAAGVRVVQYRAKRGIVAERLRALRDRARECGALLILNDDWKAAESFDCDGVHLGPGDAGFDCVATVRAALPQRLIGLSCATAPEVDAANTSDVDYVGVGSVYATVSKDDAGAPIGTASLRALTERSHVPVAAIGGITAARIPDVAETGCAMAAVITAISAASRPESAARELVGAWSRCRRGTP
jgi:thiamine-phosphate diphosphorylase